MGKVRTAGCPRKRGTLNNGPLLRPAQNRSSSRTAGHPRKRGAHMTVLFFLSQSRRCSDRGAPQEKGDPQQRPSSQAKTLTDRGASQVKGDPQQRPSSQTLLFSSRTPTGRKSRKTGCLVHFGLGQPLALRKIPGGKHKNAISRC